MADGNIARAVPTPEQAAWQDLEVGMFVHWGPRIYRESPEDDTEALMARMDPTELDTEQWADVAVSMGARYVVLVAKHIDGFCLWPTTTGDFHIGRTPWRGGRGDIVGDLAASCRAHGLGLGLYLCPRDDYHGAKNSGVCATPEAQERYQRIYRTQLTELLTGYGEIVEVWFDGSSDLEVGDLLREHAPEAMVFQSRHATIRWVGNEDGFATYPAWNAVPAADAATGVATNRHGDPDGDVWLPLECDARLRADWFWSRENESSLKGVDRLMEMYMRSVGHGAVLLLNQTPDRSGSIPDADARRAAEFGAEIRRRLGNPLAETPGTGDTVFLEFAAPTAIDHVVLMEDIGGGERVRRYVVEGSEGAGWFRLCSGTAIGHKKIDRFPARTVSRVRFRCLESSDEPQVRRFAAFYTSLPELTDSASVVPEALVIGDWGRELFYGRGHGNPVALEFDVTSACDDAGQYEVTFAKTGGADDLVVDSLVLVLSGQEYPRWVSVTDRPNVFHISLIGIDESILLRALVRGQGGPDSQGRVLIARRAAGENEGSDNAGR